MNKPDVILLCELPLGTSAMYVPFFGTDVDKAVEFAGEPTQFPAPVLDKLSRVYEREGYKFARLLGTGFKALVGVKEGFDPVLGSDIARTFLRKVKEAVSA